MRAVLFLGLMCGGLAMAEDEPKKDEKFPDKVTYRYWDGQGKQFLPAVENWPAKFVEIKGESAWRLKSANLPGPTPSRGSEVTTKDGIWVVTKVADGNGYYLLYVKKKDPPKKD
jgi:hypothetical protein